MNEKQNRFWVLPVYKSVEAQDPVGPFPSYEEMLIQARQIRRQQSLDDGLFWLCMDQHDQLASGSFGHLELFPDEETQETTNG